MVCKPLRTITIRLHSTTRQINGIAWFCNKTLVPDLELTSPLIRNASGLKMKVLFLICGTLLHLSVLSYDGLSGSLSKQGCGASACTFCQSVTNTFFDFPALPLSIQSPTFCLVAPCLLGNESQLQSFPQIILQSSFNTSWRLLCQFTSGQGRLEGGSRGICDKASRSKRPHNTQCFKVWGPHRVNQQ